MYLTNDSINLADWLNICIVIVMDIYWSYKNLVFWAGIVWHRISANQVVRDFKLEKLNNYMMYQVDFLLLLKLQKISYYFELWQKILLVSQFAEFFYFCLVWLVNLNYGYPLSHCTFLLFYFNLIAGRFFIFLLLCCLFVLMWKCIYF